MSEGLPSHGDWDVVLETSQLYEAELAALRLRFGLRFPLPAFWETPGQARGPNRVDWGKKSFLSWS